jgi:hypothetical protein
MGVRRNAEGTTFSSDAFHMNRRSGKTGIRKPLGVDLIAVIALAAAARVVPVSSARADWSDNLNGGAQQA